MAKKNPTISENPDSAAAAETPVKKKAPARKATSGAKKAAPRKSTSTRAKAAPRVYKTEMLEEGASAGGEGFTLYFDAKSLTPKKAVFSETGLTVHFQSFAAG
jgi:hypothetical protein